MNQIYQDFMARMKRRFLIFTGSIVLFFFLFSSPKSAEYVIYDDRTNAGYVTDERTYNEWVKRGSPPAEQFLKYNDVTTTPVTLNIS